MKYSPEPASQERGMKVGRTEDSPASRLGDGPPKPGGSQTAAPNRHLWAVLRRTCLGTLDLVHC